MKKLEMSPKDIQRLRNELNDMERWYLENPSFGGEYALPRIREVRNSLPPAIGPDGKHLQ